MELKKKFIGTVKYFDKDGTFSNYAKVIPSNYLVD